jgi:hypothetical protein
MACSTATTGTRHSLLPSGASHSFTRWTCGRRPRSRRAGRCSRPRMTRRSRARPRRHRVATRRPTAPTGRARSGERRSRAASAAGSPQRVAVQEVVERGLGDLPGGLVDLAAVRGGELPEVEAGIGAGPAVVDQTAHHPVVGHLRRRRDGQQRGHGLEGVIGDHMQLLQAGRAGRRPGGHAAVLRPAAHGRQPAHPRGASVKAVQRQLGHATTSITLDTYGRLFPDELDAPRPLGGPSRPGAGGAAGRRGVAPRWPRGRRLRQTCRSVAREARAGGGARSRLHPAPAAEALGTKALRPAGPSDPS